MKIWLLDFKQHLNWILYIPTRDEPVAPQIDFVCFCANEALSLLECNCSCFFMLHSALIQSFGSDNATFGSWQILRFLVGHAMNCQINFLSWLNTMLYNWIFNFQLQISSKWLKNACIFVWAAFRVAACIKLWASQEMSVWLMGWYVSRVLQHVFYISIK